MNAFGHAANILKKIEDAVEGPEGRRVLLMDPANTPDGVNLYPHMWLTLRDGTVLSTVEAVIKNYKDLLDAMYRRKAQAAAELGVELMHIAANAMANNAINDVNDRDKYTKWFHVTMRPDGVFENVRDFYAGVKAATEHIYNGATPIEWTLAFEQVGTASTNDIGAGFHAHWVVKIALGRKPNGKPDTNYSGAKFADRIRRAFPRDKRSFYIHAEYAATPDNLVATYLQLHTSRDGHKDATTEADALWRQREGLKAIYTDVDGL